MEKAREFVPTDRYNRSFGLVFSFLDLLDYGYMFAWIFSLHMYVIWTNALHIAIVHPVMRG